MRVAVVLAIASMLVIAAAADASLEAASAQKYDKKTHKHEKENEYKNKPDGYKPDGYKPDGYKPDGYKPDGYKHKEHKYGKEYRPEGYGYEPEGYGYDGYRTNPYPKPYEHDSYDHEYDSYGKYSEPSPYDGGFWGGMRGRQRINLQTVYYENLLNTTLIDGRQIQPFLPATCVEDDIDDTCAADFGVFCAWRHHEDQPSYGYGDYASAKYGPIFKTEPAVPVALGKGYWTFNSIFPGPPFVNLVTFNGHQKGYKFGEISGFINFVAGASQCHPLLGPNTKVTFNGARVPAYLIFGKVKLPVDPAILLPLGGYPYLFDSTRQTTAKVMGEGKSEQEGYKTTTDDYKTTSEGTKYTVKGDTAYVLSKKDNTLCGLTLVARGPVVVTVRPENMMGDPTVYTGTLEWPIVWTDLITTLPLLVSDTVNPRQMPPPRQLDAAIGLYLEKTLDRVASICESNDDIPWITPGAFTLDVSPSS